MTLLLVLGGLPGTGKMTIARQLAVRRSDEYSYDGPIGLTTNRDFDGTVGGG
ncbi:MAG: hypothetical protein HIU85_15860 [Proteobacteria bacterium]|nr:hypothetical protein [Pseudomonadota bacterium]